jgi:hypothetical protein
MSTSWQIGLGTCTKSWQGIELEFLDNELGAENLELDLTNNDYQNNVERVRKKKR